MIDEDFRTLLVVLLPANTAIEKGTISDNKPSTRVYFQRSTTNVELDLDGTPGIAESMFDVEVGSLNDGTTQTLIDQIKTGNTALAVLDGAIDADDTAITVENASGIPSGVFTAWIGSEQVKVTSKAGVVLTVVRGWNGTTAASQ